MYFGECFEGLLGLLGNLLGPFWRPFGASRGLLSPSWGALGASFGNFGGILDDTAPKMAPKSPREPPRAPKDGPKKPQEVPKRPSKRVPSNLQEGPRCPPNASQRTSIGNYLQLHSDCFLLFASGIITTRFLRSWDHSIILSYYQTILLSL